MLLAILSVRLAFSSQSPKALGSLFRSRGIRSASYRPNPLSNILLVQKQNDGKVRNAFDRVVDHLRANYPLSNLFLEPRDPACTVGFEAYSDNSDAPIDLVVALGGDGTVLHASSLFRDGPVPPVLSFSLGTLGFLLPFHIDSFPAAFSDVSEGNVTILPRMRLSCHISGRTIPGDGENLVLGHQVMNEVTIHRGRNPHLTVIDVFVDGQHMTESVSDGLLISTPTGSTAYSLSSGGPIVHPSMKALLMTPICPLSLSFRPVILPGTSIVTMKISHRSRAPAELSMDGRDARFLQPGDSVMVMASPYPIPCINRPTSQDLTAPGGNVFEGGEDDVGHAKDGWVQDINRLLNFNASFKSTDSEVPTP